MHTVLTIAATWTALTVAVTGVAVVLGQGAKNTAERAGYRFHQ